MDKKKILVVEDDQVTSTFLNTTLTKAGYDVVLAANGKVALDLIKGMKPHLIVADVMMPEMNGYEFFKRVKALGDTSDIPFIVLTGRHDIGETFTELDIDDFFGKPIETEKFLARVEVLVSFGRKKSLEQMKVEADAREKKFRRIFRVGLIVMTVLVLTFVLWLVMPSWDDKKMGAPEYVNEDGEVVEVVNGLE